MTAETQPIKNRYHGKLSTNRRALPMMRSNLLAYSCQIQHESSCNDPVNVLNYFTLEHVDMTAFCVITPITTGGRQEFGIRKCGITATY